MMAGLFSLPLCACAMTTAPVTASEIASETAASAPAPSAAAAGAAPARRARGRGRRSGGQPAGGPAPAQAPARSQHPLLAQLAAWYPALFGQPPLALKRGIFEDLLAAHPEVEPAQLKEALAQHARSSRYLTAVAAARERFDLQGQAVEALAPEHVYHALTEVFRRRQLRAPEDLAPKLRQRIVQAWQASGLSREDYAALVRGRNEQANAQLDAALQEAAERAARDEALLRAFTASGQASEAAFAEMYGMAPRAVAQSLARARASQG